MENDQEWITLPGSDDTVGENLSLRLIFLLSESKFGIFDIDINNRSVLIDYRWANMLGYEVDELAPMTFELFNSLVHPEDLARSQQLLLDQFRGITKTPYDAEVRLKHKDGSWRWIRSRGKVTGYSTDGEPLLLTGFNEDITEERRRDLELQVSRQQLQAAQRIAGIGSWFLDLATDEVTWSKELYDIQGLDPNEPPPPATTHEQLFDAESWERLSAALEATRIKGIPYELELKMERDGSFFGWMLARGEAVFDSDGNIIGVQGVAMDISERKNTESTLQKQAAMDSLTGLGNRGYMNYEVEKALMTANQDGSLVGCLMVDLDNFKAINDTYGHATGDSVIKEAALRLTETTRGTDSVFRPGGDEFVVLLPNVRSSTIAHEVAQRIVEAFHSPIFINGSPIECTVSVGGTLTDGSNTTSELLREADRAMYRAKESGRNGYTFFEDQQQLAGVERMNMESSLKASVGTDQFTVHYQPIVELHSGKVTGAEALLRWNSPSGEILAAKKFIRIAEETGILREIGAFSLHEACKNGAEWVKSGLKRVHVNISPSQLSQTTFLEILDHALESASLAPSALCLEINETTLLRNTSMIKSNIEGIHARGVDLALDDFGTGYASMSYLNEFPIDILKLDRVFVRSATRDSSDARVLKGSLVVARALELEFISEGIESESEVFRLQELGCTLGQGNFISPPVPAGEFLKILQQRVIIDQTAKSKS